MESKFYRKDVAKHKTHDDGWIIINKHVYNISNHEGAIPAKFISHHPGGESILFQFLGDDGTDGFEKIGHSTSAIDILKKYLIGNLID